MAMYDGSRVEIGAGSLYAAPLGTTEPNSVTGTWTGWFDLGYTDQGSMFSYTPTVAEVTVEEEVLPIRYVTTGVKATMKFAMAETTVQNLLLALNSGIGSSTVAATTGTNLDTSIWAEPAAPGTEARVMIGWDAIPKGATSGTNPYGRIICRQCFQTGAVTIDHRKGNNKSLYSVEFSLEKPPSAEPVRFIKPPALAA